jgi:uncharacterized membrane protein
MDSRTDPAEDGDETPLQQLVAGVVIALIFLVGFGLLAVGYPWFWVAFPVGFAGVLPAALAVVKWYEMRQAEQVADTTPDELESALATLRRRYAEGEIDEAEFEQRVERLLGTESVADAEEYVERLGRREKQREAEQPTERER